MRQGKGNLNEQLFLFSGLSFANSFDPGNNGFSFTRTYLFFNFNDSVLWYLDTGRL
jgi:hypothetical protein